MLRKTLAVLAATAVISGALSWAATSFQLQTKLNNSGGTLQIRNNPVQTVSGTVVYTNFTTAELVPVKVTANPGYKITSLTKTGVAQVIGNYTTHYTTTFKKADGSPQSLIAGFTAQKYTVTGTAYGPGGITPASTQVTYNGTAVFTATPNANSVLTAVSGGTATTLSGGAISFPYLGQANITARNVTGPAAVTASFSAVGISAGENQTGMVATKVTLRGSMQGGGTFTWNQESGPAVTLLQASTLNPDFVPMVLGTYVFRATQYMNGVAVSTSTTQVKVVDSLIDSMRTDCNGCHSATGVYPTPMAFTLWSSSNHKSLGVSCVSCHTTGAMPTPVNVSSVDSNTFVNLQASAGPVGDYFCAACHTDSIFSGYDRSMHKKMGVTCTSCHKGGAHQPEADPGVCAGCHYNGLGIVPNHTVEIGRNVLCISCHNPHSSFAAVQGDLETLHYGNMTTGAYPATYVTSRSACTDCHFSTVSNQAIRQAWYTSGHAKGSAPAYSTYDFKTMNGCVQCHTTTGFVAYSTAKVTTAWGDSADKTKEMVTCRACHVDIVAGALRTMAPSKPFANEPTYLNPAVGESNLCMTCHSGTNTGQVITDKLQSNADFTNLAFIPPHYAVSAATMYAKGGYHFPGRSYDLGATHSNLGFDNAKGPCIMCHRNGTYGHSFRSGVSAICTNCHGANMPEEQRQLARDSFTSLLEVLRAQLAAKGFIYMEKAPHFNERNWGSGQQGANVMGAAFNYALLVRELGSFGHNPRYSKQLAMDSIDILDNGVIDDSVTTLAVPTLRDAGAISQAVADSVVAYKARNLCITCHGGSASTPSPMATNQHATHITAVYGPGAYLGSEYTVCQACHIGTTATHNNGSPDLKSGDGSLCMGCHAGQLVDWKTTARIECTVCHAQNAAVLPNGTQAPFKAYFGTKGHGRFAVSNQCTVCHDRNATHITGTLGDSKRLLMTNDNTLCASCHNNAAVVPARILNLGTHVTKDNMEIACRECHDTHGTGNLSMIRGEIRGFNIAYTDRVNTLVETIYNRGLCQVCHTKTNYYRAGVPESSHFTSGCLDCHTHTSAGGAFKPIGGGCDSCHGYPPAPKNTATGFGSYANWANARFEDYSGGGGAHLVAAHISPFAKAEEGWTNCTVCHNGGATGLTPYHKMVTPVKEHIENVTVLVDNSLRFANSFTIYTGAKLTSVPGANQTGSCFNIACHMSPSARWSTER
ncbi:cytochrome C [Geomonas subterranea]|uniref:Cytochrome C n=1 Tax=Geomonas subterranea TaxID=2847989 RepID=A0ABX8LIK0_9BACT|nr:cytochrome C [Geomonas subterranea]QXE90535.1 cytochrome C [Geomonas subterranea]QXM11387.1 cytochrome C [Geomonas subterranea]